jgi:hypothetical protein
VKSSAPPCSFNGSTGWAASSWKTPTTAGRG